VSTITLIEPDQRASELLIRALSDTGHTLRAFASGLTALDDIVRVPPDVVVLDLAVSDIDGRQLLVELRAISQIPIIATSYNVSETDMARILLDGADDYIVKPFGVIQLDARIVALLRRTRILPSCTDLEIAGLRIDRARHTVHLDGRFIDVKRREFDLLAYLAARPGIVVSKRELLAEVWRQPWGGSEKTIDVHVSWLRRKLGERAANPRFLRTVRGVGVQFCAVSPSADGVET
jgi:two-component system, OmpR family, response regulator PrrA